MHVAAVSSRRELAMVDMSSARAARVKRELDEVVQKAAKRRKLEFTEVAVATGGDRARMARASTGTSAVQPLVSESTSRNPFRRQRPSAPSHIPTSLLSSVSASSSSSSATGYTRIGDQEEEEARNGDDDENGDGYTVFGGDNDDEIDNDFNDDDDDDDDDGNAVSKLKQRNCTSTTKQKTRASAPVRAQQQPLETNPNANGSGRASASASKSGKAMIPITDMKIPVLSSEMRREALARERKESGGSASITKSKPKFKNAADATAASGRKTANTNSTGNGKPKTIRKSGGQFDWTTWGGGTTK